MSKPAPYGTWDSPITADTVLGIDTRNITFVDVLVDSAVAGQETIYHLEEVPASGRCTVKRSQDEVEVLPPPYSARSLVQEYGGAPAIVYNETIYFSNESDRRIYTLKIGSKGATPVTPEDTDLFFRYADFALSPKQRNLLVALREDHTNDDKGQNPRAVENTICVVNVSAATPNVKVVIQGAGFYASPVFSPSGDKIAWQQWDLPDMPWQGGQIYVGNVVYSSDSLTVEQPVLVAGAAKNISATFPLWISDNQLAYICDSNGYQNPYTYNTETTDNTIIWQKDQDFAEPAWYFGLYPYAILGNGAYGVFTAFKDGANIIYLIDFSAGVEPTVISKDYTVAQHVRKVDEATFVFTASRSAAPGGIVKGTVAINEAGYAAKFDVLQYSADPGSDLLKYVSQPEPMNFEGVQQQLIHAVFYKPYNPNYSGPDDEKPPCIVHVHGGPTGLEPQALNWTKMYYTSRGFAWLDVNYRGSSGYGREYSDGLYGEWGRFDVQDCHDAAVELAKKSRIDETRVAIRGGSAGAYVTLASLTFAPSAVASFYKTACGAYGCVADIENLAKVSEKFEIDYIPTLIGVPLKKEGDWAAWNPIAHAANIQRPLLVLQGLADGVVHPDMLRDFLSKAIHGPSGGFAFYEKEGHHWHLESTIRNALAREHNWYQDTLL